MDEGTRENSSNKRAFVIGNGVSRKPIDLTKLGQYGRTYGCNRLYETFAPDVLISTDMMISTEIQKSGYSLKHIHYCRTPMVNMGARQLIKPVVHGSGLNAIFYAIKEGNEDIYLLGFDLSGVDGKINNVYAGTKYYRTADQKAYDYSGWARQMCELAEKHVNVNFIRVIDENCVKPPRFAKLSNVKHINVADFLQLFACSC